MASVNIGWNGLNKLDNQPSGLLFTPPDASIAVGPNHVVEMANNVMRVWDKDGNPSISIALLNDFFKTGGYTIGGVFLPDPNVVYDVSSGHWFASILNAGTITIRIYITGKSQRVFRNYSRFRVRIEPVSGRFILYNRLRLFGINL